MKTEKESFSFGRYLQSLRLEKKINLEKVSEETRIAISNLQLIEKEDLEALPDEVFVKGFLRSYARAIGADGDEAVKLYETRLNMVSRLADAGRYSPRSSLFAWRNLILSIAVILAVIVLSLYGVSYFQGQMPEPETVETPVGSEHSEAEPPQQETDSSVKKSATPQPLEKLVLHITAVDDTWIKVIVDNKDSKEYNLISGEKLELEASAGFNLLIGNAGGLELEFNGKPIKISGKAGEVVNIQLP
jgi:transcriptional regulator with XRE-family HTH domain